MNKTLEPETTTVKAQAAAPQPLSTDGQRSDWLTANEAAAYLKVAPRTLLMWARQGKVNGHVLSGTRRHVWRFRHVDLDGMLTAPSVPVAKGAK